MNTVISNGKVLGTCQRCGKVVQLNKALLGGLHFCLNDCEVAGEHLALREEIRGHLWWKRNWKACSRCGVEWKVS